MHRLLVKVCGMRELSNIKEVVKCEPDYVGLIFFDKSPRNAEGAIPEKLWEQGLNVILTGVFVNASVEFISSRVEKYGLGAIQLHGNENVEFIKKLRGGIPESVKVIKVFSVDNAFDFGTLAEYEPIVDYFLFDTKGENKGGNGVKFDWELLNNINTTKPYFLSGGIDDSDVELIKSLQKKHSYLYGIDINSKFEISPGVKNVQKIDAFIKYLKLIEE